MEYNQGSLKTSIFNDKFQLKQRIKNFKTFE